MITDILATIMDMPTLRIISTILIVEGAIDVITITTGIMIAASMVISITIITDPGMVPGTDTRITPEIAIAMAPGMDQVTAVDLVRDPVRSMVADIMRPA